MKRIVCLWAMALALGMSADLQAQRIATVDLQKVFSGYWKTKQADGKLKERQEGFNGARKSLLDEYGAANEAYRQLIESANDQAVSSEERDRRAKEAESKLLDLREIENSIQQFDKQAVTTLEDQKKRARNDIVREITELIVTIAKRDSYNLVLDVSGQSHNQATIVLYTDGSNDISPELLRMLNANAPPQFGGAQK